MLWEVDIYPADGLPDLAARRVVGRSIGAGHLPRAASHCRPRLPGPGGSLKREDVLRLARELLADHVVERTVVAPVGDSVLSDPPTGRTQLIHVLPKPGVMDPVAQARRARSTISICRPTPSARCASTGSTTRPNGQSKLLCSKVLANDAIEQVIVGPLPFERLGAGLRVSLPARHGADSRAGRRTRCCGSAARGSFICRWPRCRRFRPISASWAAIRPTSSWKRIAQTWSEHCSHKTLAGPDRVSRRARRRGGSRTCSRRRSSPPRRRSADRLGDDDWCVSVFKDNAGVVRFDDAVQRRASRSRRTIIPRRSSPTAARTPGSAA